MRRKESKFASPDQLAFAKGLGAAVRAARLARNTTQQSIAERARMSPQTWLKIEKGDVSVALGSWISALAQVGLLSRLSALSHHEIDAVGERLRESQLRARARPSQASAREYDF